LAVIVLARLQIKNCQLHPCGWSKTLLCIPNQSGLRWTESNVDFLAMLTCLRHCDTSQTAWPFKEGWICVDGLTGVIKSSDICRRNNGHITIMRLCCVAWWSQNAWRETVQIQYTFYCNHMQNFVPHFTDYYSVCIPWLMNSLFSYFLSNKVKSELCYSVQKLGQLESK